MTIIIINIIITIVTSTSNNKQFMFVSSYFYYTNVDFYYAVNGHPLLQCLGRLSLPLSVVW